MSQDGELTPQQRNPRCEHSPRVVTVAVEATGGTRVGPGDRVRRGQDLGVAPGFGGRVLCPVSGTVEACGFDPRRHVFEITIVADE
ncbi:MAG: hypothetical protein ACM3X3_04060 [Betaproteobacteria bacterium]